jgi:Protein of unknown function (DUF3435)
VNSKTYTFNLDENPFLCIITHIATLAFNDDAFDSLPGGPQVTPELLFTLGVRQGLNAQRLPWRPKLKGIPIFRAPIRVNGLGGVSPDQALTYGTYHPWLRQAGIGLGLPQILTTYCLRRATGNAINGKPSSSAGVEY